MDFGFWILDFRLIGGLLAVVRRLPSAVRRLPFSPSPLLSFSDQRLHRRFQRIEGIARIAAGDMNEMVEGLFVRRDREIAEAALLVGERAAEQVFQCLIRQALEAED